MKEIETSYLKNESIEKGNKSKYQGAYVRSKNEVTEEIKSHLASGELMFLFRYF